LLAPVLPWSVAPRPGEYHFNDAAATLAFARANRMPLTGSHLLWHEWLPAWFAGIADRAEAERLVRQHVTTLATLFAGEVYSWNVVNEAIRPEDGRPDGLRITPLLEKLGPGYIAAAFATARAADPRAKLLYNDYDMEATSQEARRDALLRLLDQLQGQGAPIDGVGLQSHLRPSMPPDDRRYRGFLRDIAGRGLEIAVTELDVIESGTLGSVAGRDQVVADCYARFLAIVLDEHAVSSVVIWGLSDRYSWENAPSRPRFRRRDGLPARPLPFDEEFRPKPAFHAIIHALKNAAAHRSG
jgi:endo-1,4-beta-xylanase